MGLIVVPLQNSNIIRFIKLRFIEIFYFLHAGLWIKLIGYSLPGCRQNLLGSWGIYCHLVSLFNLFVAPATRLGAKDVTRGSTDNELDNGKSHSLYKSLSRKKVV